MVLRQNYILPIPERSWARHESVSRIKTSSRGCSEILIAGSLGKRSKKERENIRHSVREMEKRRKRRNTHRSPRSHDKKRKLQPKKRPVKRNNSEVGEITFPPLRNISSTDPVIIKSYVSGRQVNMVYLDGGSSCEVIYEHCFFKIKPFIRSLRVDSAIPLVGFSGEKSWPLGENPKEPKEEQRPTSEEHQEEVKGILSCVDTRKDSGGATFNTDDRINEIKHLEPVKQKKRSLAPERNKAIHTQVEELTKANILREVKYQTWVLNPIIVKKASQRWKLCIDFTNINKACPKEHHSIPMIEQKVEDLYKHRLKCFLDAYKGYHHIPIADKDEEKTAFYIREGVFCYRRLPFGLKKAGATYQRLIDKVFNHQLGRNMEVNAYDIIIKSDVEEEMLVDIKETLDELQAINLKLNPKKCSFGIEEGIFSGHLITKQGIKASPSKVMAISDLQPPKSVSEIQNLNKRLEALNRLCIAKEMRVQELTIFVDSQLVANQVNGLFEARQTVIKQYLDKAKELLANFSCHTKEHIKRDQTKKEDALSKLALMTFSKLAKKVLVEVIKDKSITQKEFANVTHKKEDSWMIPILEYLQFGKLPDDPQKARKLRIKALLYRIMDGTLYRRSYLSPWLRCVGETQAKSIFQEVHQGSCGMHAGPQSVVLKIIRLGYYWSSMHKDATSLIQRCETCQIHSPIPRKPKQEMTSIMSVWPFSQ
uniref:Reverse transcriptase domain-containing protein n=1 Tax=Tanacetum cinerariifolium TaxID=118510 RepID=A0A6L2JZP6_TANCI|nr:reverse transcriptase domain-containing protein [Tanacetum cinerariifolium]